MKHFELGFVLIMVLTGTLSCQTNAPVQPAADQVTWKNFTHINPNYRLQYPDIYTVHDYGKDIIFRNQRHPSLVINYCTRKEADKRGLWADHKPMNKVKMKNRDWDQYIYKHYDGPFSMRTISFVTQMDNHFLSIDFRTDGELDGIAKKILTSFQLTGKK